MRELAHLTTLIYNGILRGLNSSYNHAEAVSSSSTAQNLAFLRFNQCLCDIINYQIETVIDKYLFQELKRDSDDLVTQQAALNDQLESYKEYVYSTEAQDLDGSKLRAHIHTFAPALREYLVHHIAWILTHGAHVVSSEIYTC